MHAYRTHKCSEIRASHVGETVRVSGWVHKKRDHGDLVFIDLRDHYGIVQIVTEVDGPAFDVIESLRNESVVTVTGKVRSEEHTSELQSLMRISYAVFCLKKKQ